MLTVFQPRRPATTPEMSMRRAQVLRPSHQAATGSPPLFPLVSSQMSPSVPGDSITLSSPVLLFFPSLALSTNRRLSISLVFVPCLSTVLECGLQGRCPSAALVGPQSPSRLRFLHLSTTDSLDRIILHRGGCPVHRKLLSGACGLHSLRCQHHCPPPTHTIAKCPLGKGQNPLWLRTPGLVTCSREYTQLGVSIYSHSHHGPVPGQGSHVCRWSSSRLVG